MLKPIDVQNYIEKELRVKGEAYLGRGVGKLVLVPQAGRESKLGRNPRTGDEFMMKAREDGKRVVFKVSQTLKDEYRGKELP